MAVSTLVIEVSDLVLVGRVARAHGNSGQVIVNPDTDFPDERFRVGAVVLVGPAATARRIRAVDSSRDGRSSRSTASRR